MSEKYKIPTTDKEIYDLVKDKVLDSFKKRGLKVLCIMGWSELMSKPFIIQSSMDIHDDARLMALYNIAIMDYLKHISEELEDICVYHEVGAKIIENLENSIREVLE